MKDSLELKELEIQDSLEFKKANIHTFFKAYKSNLLKIFFVYLILICSFFYFIDSNNKVEQNLFSKINLKTKEINENSKFEYLSPKIIALFSSSKKYSVEILNLSLKDSIIVLKLQGEQKDSIYKFLQQMKEIKIEDMSFDKTKKVYLANASFKIFRK